MTRSFNEISPMAFTCAATRRQVASIMADAAMASPTPVPLPLQGPVQVELSQQTLERLSRAVFARPRDNGEPPRTRDALERELSEPLMLLELLFPEEATLRHKITRLKRLLARASLEELQP